MGQVRALSAGRTVRACVALGLGSFEASKVAREQLAFLRVLVEGLSVQTVVLHDPVMTPADKGAAEALGFKVFGEAPAEEFDDLLAGLGFSGDAAGGATLYYMPHCPRSLNERWLAVQISRGVLQDAILVGNSPGDYALRSTREGLLTWCAARAKELRIVMENSDPLIQAFAGMAVVKWDEKLEPPPAMIKVVLDAPISNC